MPGKLYEALKAVKCYVTRHRYEVAAVACLVIYLYLRATMSVFCIDARYDKTFYLGVKGISQAVPKSTLIYCYVLQYDKYTPNTEYSESKRQPLFAIVWKATTMGSYSINTRNRITSIHGHRLTLSFNAKAIYALQRNYKLKPIPLSAGDIDHILSLMDKERILHDDDVWLERVVPHLEYVQQAGT